MDNLECGCLGIVGIAVLIFLIAGLTGNDLGGLGFVAIFVIGAFLFATRNS